MIDSRVSFLYRNHSIRRLVCDKFSIGNSLPEEIDTQEDLENWIIPHRYQIASKIAERVTRVNSFTLLDQFELEVFDDFL